MGSWLLFGTLPATRDWNSMETRMDEHGNDKDVTKRKMQYAKMHVCRGIACFSEIEVSTKRDRGKTTSLH